MASAMAAFYEDIPIGHIEAGLRTGNKKSPFPEEMNRTIIGRVADFHFAPTQGARVNLLSEGVLEDHVYVTGNTVIDALHSTLNLLRVNKILQAQLDEKFNYLRSDKKLILVTGHRRESFGLGFENICQALSRIAKREDVEILYPVHLNPNVLRPVHKLLGNASNIHLIEPLDYLPFVYVMNRSHVLLTDSGGIQEEGPSLGKPVLVMRNVTERPEAVTAGTVKLVGTDAECIASNVYRLLDDSKEYLRMSQSHNPYGDGTASSQIFSIIRKIRI
jgi:UDP-N-acetylglucosamine 2-epimerase (non-hydrolysing)